MPGDGNHILPHQATGIIFNSLRTPDVFKQLLWEAVVFSSSGLKIPSLLWLKKN